MFRKLSTTSYSRWQQAQFWPIMGKQSGNVFQNTDATLIQKRVHVCRLPSASASAATTLATSLLLLLFLDLHPSVHSLFDVLTLMTPAKSHLLANPPIIPFSPELERLNLISAQLVARSLFSFAFLLKKNVGAQVKMSTH